ncbi:glycosyltransferase family 39 protein [Actinospica robiniae]|uniref:glycosyltransferase family 39 protein n=1 Tax=Actinospica robiniae TaxID=304901 RepID=UPI00054EFA5A|nr:glycosyltransferase family 39 protein [Actinospica robiniae]
MADTFARARGVDAESVTRRGLVGRVDDQRDSRLTESLSRHRWLLAALAAGVVLPLIVAVVTGGLSIPHNDGWAYSRIAAHFAHTGDVDLVGWNRSALIGQFALLGPLAAHVTAQQTFVVVLALVGLVSVYDLLIRSLGPRNAGIATLMLALWPGFGLLDTSFITDVPALAATFLCLAVGRRALARDSLVLFGLAIIAGFWGTTIRAQALAAPVALLLYAALTRHSRARVRLLAAGACAVAFAVGFAVFNAWFEGLPGGDLPPYRLVSSPLGTAVSTTLQSYFTVALPAAPAVFWAARPRSWSRAARCTALVTAALSFVAVLHFRQGLFPGNYLAQEGSYAHASVSVSTVLPDWFWLLLSAIALVSGSLLAGLIAHKARQADKLVAVFTVTFTAGTIGTFLLGEFVYDRYLIEILPGMLAVALLPEPISLLAQRTATGEAPAASSRRPPASAAWTRRISALAAGLLVGCAGLILLTDGLSTDEQQWNAAAALQASGVPAMRIDAGLDWLGFHDSGSVINRSPAVEDRPLGYFTDQPACYVVSQAAETAQRGWSLAEVTAFQRFLLVGTAHEYVYATHAAGCPG